MSSDDFDMVAYRVLRYIDACTKGGVSPTVTQARELSKVRDSYLASVLESLSEFDVDPETGQRQTLAMLGTTPALAHAYT